MSDILQMVGILAVVFGVSMGVSYAMTMKSRRKVQLIPIPENTSCRIIGPGGVYRSYFMSRNKKGLVFSAPLQKNSYVPVRVGEILMVQAPMADSIVTFRAAVIERNTETHEYTLEIPERLRHVNRRVENRDRSMEGTVISVNGAPATLVDLSACGAKVIVGGNIEPGDTLSVDLPQDFGTAYGWALEATPVAHGRRLAKTVRVRFDTPLSGFSSKQRRQLYIGD